MKLEAYYTQNRQFNVKLETDVWLPGNRYALGAKAQFQEWPTSFYGIGNTYADSLKEAYTERIVLASAEVQRRFRPGLYAGLRLDIRHSDLLEVQSGGALAAGTVVGRQGGMASSLGLFLSVDTRNEVFYPTHGRLIRLETRLFGRPFGSDYTFTQHRLDARQYVGLFGAHVLALQGVFRLSTGAPPGGRHRVDQRRECRAAAVPLGRPEAERLGPHLLTPRPHQAHAHQGDQP